MESLNRSFHPEDTGKTDPKILSLRTGFYRMALKEKILAVMGGLHVSAVATITEGKPAVRFMALTGFDDLTLVGATMKDSRKVGQIKKNPEVALSIWSCKEFSDPSIVIQAKCTVHEDVAVKMRYWNPMYEQYFQNPENPVFVILKFVPQKIEYSHENTMEIWEK